MTSFTLRGNGDAGSFVLSEIADGQGRVQELFQFTPRDGVTVRSGGTTEAVQLSELCRLGLVGEAKSVFLIGRCDVSVDSVRLTDRTSDIELSPASAVSGNRFFVLDLRTADVVATSVSVTAGGVSAEVTVPRPTRAGR